MPQAASSAAPESAKSFFWTLLRIVGALTLVGLAVRHTLKMDHGELPWRTIDPQWLVLCFVLTAISILGLWVRWLIFLKLTGVPATAGEAFRLTWIADFFNYFFIFKSNFINNFFLFAPEVQSALFKVTVILFYLT